MYYLVYSFLIQRNRIYNNMAFIDVAPFRWSKYGVFPDFDDTATNRDFIFETVEFSLPNTPGISSV